MNLQEQISRIKNVIQMISESNYLTQPMKMGVEDDEVEILQTLLKIPVTGEFDQETEDCVREFQTFTDIRIDGIVGPETRGKLNDLLDDKLQGWLGCKKTPLEDKKESLGGLDPNAPKATSGTQNISSKDIVGSDWRSCKAWFGKGGLAKWGDKIKIEKNTSGFLISYDGPASGLSIAHAMNGGDTIHQLYNVLICEINPFLAQGKMKPNLDGITFQTGKNGKNSMLSIFVPLTSAEGVWQLDRRGGWGHDPGGGKMSRKCSKLTKEGKECIGPVTKVVNGPFGKITEYFITHQG